MKKLQLKNLSCVLSRNLKFKNLLENTGIKKKEIPPIDGFQESRFKFAKPRYLWKTHGWQNQHKNLHLTYKSVSIREILEHNLKKRGFQLNLFIFQKNHGSLSVNAKFCSFYTPKFTKIFKNLNSFNAKRKKKLYTLKLNKFPHSQKWESLYKNNVFRSLLKNKTKVDFLKNKNLKALSTSKVSNQELVSISKAIINLSMCSSVSLSLWKTSLPKTYVLDNAQNAFSRFKSNIHFWSGLQTLRLIVSGQGSAQLLAYYVANGVRRNRKRVAFIVYLKRLIDWHFKAVEELNIQGIRVETKGRFNAKSRCRKYILSVGRVAKGEKNSYVDYAFTEAYTVFGSLGIKVWVCPN